MASIRCPNCNFLNFANESACKRCRQPIGNAVPETVSAGYAGSNYSPSPAPAVFQKSPPQRQPQPQPQAQQLPQQQVQLPATSYYEPPPPNFYRDLGAEHPRPFIRNAPPNAPVTNDLIPPVCARCGGGRDLAMKSFKKDYTPPIAYIGVFGGILPLLILVLVLRKRHKMNGLFCSECWNRFKLYPLFSALFAFLSLGVLIGGIIVGIAFSKPGVMFFAFVAAVGIAIYGSYFSKKISPKFVKMNRERIFINIPNYGEVDFTHTAA